MTQTTPPTNQYQFVHAAPTSATLWKRIFRIIRWTTYALGVVALVLLLHKAPPPPVETSPQAAARAEEKFEQAEKAVANGRPATLRMDETELNSYLATHLDLAGDGTPKAAPARGAQAAPHGENPTPQDVEQMRSNVRDVKVQLIEGRLGTQNGYLRFDPVRGQVGSLPIPQSTLQSAMQWLMDSPENREKLKLPSDISGLRIENGEVVASYK